MKINRLDHAGIRVMKLDQATALYEKLGFSVTRTRLFATLALDR